ncbi:ThiamineS [mine drainage metagenome]|uniref:ThiamineS n=1 Tax=mine drainage metagenome TaxID=410659 RepID=T1AAE3_9ZZZZ
MAMVRLDGMLSEFLRRRTVDSRAPTVDALLEELETDFPRLQHRLRDETRQLRPFVRVYVNGEEIGSLRGVATPLSARDTVEILHSIQGG